MSTEDEYTTQFLLLLSQAVHEACIIEPQESDFEPILVKLNKHPLVEDSLKVDANQLFQLYCALLKKNAVDIGDVGHGQKGKRAPSFATKLCEVYYIRRVEELNDAINTNSQLFNKQLYLTGSFV